LELTILGPQPPECWDCRCAPPCQPLQFEYHGLRASDKGLLVPLPLGQRISVLIYLHLAYNDSLVS
jgi:hypothetical protein